MTRPDINDPARLDAEARAQREMLLQLDLAPLQTLSPTAARARMAQSRQQAQITGPALEAVVDHAAGDLPLRLYRPRAGRLPVILFLHGGGWVLGDLDTHDVLCRHLAQATGWAVLAVDYRLAPEHPFPAAFDDAVTALTWLGAQAKALDLDPQRIALFGDSAGGNLAAATAIAAAQDARLPQPCAQILAYPVTALSQDQPSYALVGKGWPVNAEAMDWFITHYMQGQKVDWRAAPLLGNPAGTAPARVITAGYDPLCDEGIAYAAHLAKHGVAVTHHHYPGQAHGFLTALVTGEATRRELGEIAHMLNRITDEL